MYHIYEITAGLSYYGHFEYSPILTNYVAKAFQYE